MNPQREPQKSQHPSVLPNPGGTATRHSDKAIRYRVGLATSSQKESVFRLRHDVFHGHNTLNTQTIWGDASQSGTENQHSLDFDVYDSYSDHMVVTHGDKVVGTYRMLSVDRIKAAGLEPYSANEFHLEPILHHSGCRRILELGRSCIHPEHRNGTVLRLLWAALSQYLEDCHYDGMFGSVSLFSQDKEATTNLGQDLFNKGYWSKELMDPLLCRKMQQTYQQNHFQPNSLGTRQSILPPLMKGYLNLGAKICDGPFYDAEFKCFDYLMFMRVADIPGPTRRLLSRLFLKAKID